jgi:Mg2+/citrate symporter
MDAQTLVPIYLTALMVVLAVFAFVAGAKEDKREKTDANKKDA